MVTCRWEKPVGSCKDKYGRELIIYTGGNCLAVFCFKENRNLQNFIIDQTNFNKCDYKGTEYTDIKLSHTRPKEAIKLTRLFVKAGFEVTVTNKIIEDGWEDED